MRSPLVIPEEHQKGLAKLLSFSDKSFVEFRSVLQDVKPALDLGAKLSSKIQTVPADDVNAVVKTLIALHQVRSVSHVSVEEFIEDILQALEKSELPELSEVKKNKSLVKDRLTALLGLDSAVSIVAKAQELSTEHQRLFLDARILTDIRSVFADTSHAPVAAVITHTLRLEYLENDETQTWFVVLDNTDLKKLREVIDRAESKVKSVRDFLNKAGLNCLDE